MEPVTQQRAADEPQFDARGLVELNARVPRISEIDGTGETASFDARNLTTRQINLELRWLLYEEGVKEVTVENPGARHSLGAGLLTRCRIRFQGSLGYFALGMIDGPEVHIAGRVGWSACENMMSGVVVVDSNAGSLTGAAIRGGDLLIFVVAGVIAALLAIALFDLALIVLSSLAGADLVVAAMHPGAQSAKLVLIVLAVAGIAVQMGITARRRRRD